MQTSVDLQDPFSYSLYPILIIVIPLLFIILFFLVAFIMKKLKKRNPESLPEVHPVSPKERESIKQKYLKELEEIADQLNKKEISTTIAYQRLSLCIRLFVHKVTRIKVQNYTLMDIEKLDMPILYELIKEYYPPEFSQYNRGDITSSLIRTREVIEKWN